MAKPILQRLTEQMKVRGFAPGPARAIAVKTLQKSGSLKKGSTEMTAKGRERTEMGAAGRAKDREAKYSGRKPSDYKYASRTNRATLK
jgi:hypothetical protein